ncbi:uncharacterized protein BJ171DRAFT_91123 [Polychytrium aggregatum]|uniref:uncharacterized protein n=1 Tax=Polychytrium aggregatum TaxID=110093 RepID=UPI0022FDEBD5|nr:uncharacterized protein BJ171DRAFT_91123 [Polychytrium aggregatum]KAI9204888.1 hypothetical protein BJ171DRAFT_91123 [Polychytrium aggregatum]
MTLIHTGCRAQSPFHSAIDHTMKELFSPTRSDIFALKTPVMSPTPSQGSKTTDSPSRTPKATITVNTSVGLFGISGGRSALSSPKLTPYTPTKHVAPNQAMITTNASYEILTCNEVAVRLVGYSSVDIIGTNILSILCSPYREKFRKLLQAVCSVSGRATCLGSVAAGDSLLGPSVLACGSVIRIKRKDRSIYPASLWLKESANDSGSKIYIWVFEKIDEDMIELEMSSEGLLYDVCGEFSKLYGADFSAAERLYLQDICPSLLIQDDSLELLDIIKKWKFFGARSREGATFPILLRVVADQPLGTTWPNYSAKAGAPLPSEHDGPNLQPGPKSADDLDPEASIHLQLISMPNIAGVVTVHENGLIQSCNSIFTKFLFGLTSSDIVEKSDITELLPQFWQLLSAATNNGSDLKGYTPIQLIPPSKCRKVAAVSPVSAGSLTHFPTDSTPRTGGSVNVANVIAEATRSTGSLTQASRQAVMTSGVIAVHRDGTRFNVDLHIRPVHVSHEVLYAVWITFDRALHSPPMSTTQPSSPVRGLSVAGDQSPVTTGSWSTKRPPEEVAENKEELPKLPAAAIQTPAIGSPFTIDKELDIGPGSPVAVSDVLATDSVILSPQGSEPLVGERDGQGKVTEARESEGQQETKLVDSAETELKEVQGQKRDSSSEHVPEDLDEGETECSPDQFTLKEFEIIKPIGEGSYGFVRVVTRKNDPREKKYVMKFVVKSRILVECWMRDKILGLVPLEIHIMNFLKNNPHQNVVQMLKYFEDDDYFYILMDMHGHGIDLFEFIDRNQTLTEGTVRKIIYQVILAVRHLHRHDIVHRDIKDENVIVDDEYSIKLIDFGSSAYLKPNKKPFETFFGTIDYASPEILSGDKYEGKPQDVWALGILVLHADLWRDAVLQHRRNYRLQLEVPVPVLARCNRRYHQNAEQGRCPAPNGRGTCKAPLL